MKNVLAGLVIYVGIFLSVSHYRQLSFGESLQYGGVPVSTRNFVDLVVITAASDCQKTYEAIVVKNCLSDIPPFNYPRIWIVLGRSIGLSVDDTTWLGIGIIAIFLVAYLYVFKTVVHTYWPYVLALLVSPVVMLGVNRANSDLLIFSLVVAAAVWLSRQKEALGTGLLLIACLFKLYPIFAIVPLVKRKQNYYLLLCIGLFGLYCYVTLNDLLLVTKATPRGYNTSYGRYVFVDYINHYFPAFSTYLSANSWHILATILAISIPLVLVLSRKSFLPTPELSDKLSLSETLFLMGSGIYLGTFLIGNNWDYRLIFLHLTIPYILSVQTINNRQKKINTVYVLLVILISWSNIGITNFLGVSWYRPIRFLCTILEESGNWAVYAMLAVALINYLRKFIEKQPGLVQVSK